MFGPSLDGQDAASALTNKFRTKVKESGFVLGLGFFGGVFFVGGGEGTGEGGKDTTQNQSGYS